MLLLFMSQSCALVGLASYHPACLVSGLHNTSLPSPVRCDHDPAVQLAKSILWKYCQPRLLGQRDLRVGAKRTDRALPTGCHKAFSVTLTGRTREGDQEERDR
ncbi:hypothetical protein BC939DRAFT_464231 [Gamsiella multidivaricata]|uniref:uncharacterized protein n=1 Tax=Gamsiella multidivaricata TaxID=101098 RepID=UPI0022205B99|nr:uncharacterized protein BC939DRAFT_464231 [Gamsiella multidivaricata]KAI7817953.1 hypothetical protein BC939DRAFT_464231 [Gamsiella multidivaricata]